MAFEQKPLMPPRHWPVPPAPTSVQSVVTPQGTSTERLQTVVQAAFSSQAQ